jgi:hypothetical protein
VTSGLALGVASLVMSRSRRLRWLVPVLPIAVAVYRFVMQPPAPPPVEAAPPKRRARRPRHRPAHR